MNHNTPGWGTGAILSLTLAMALIASCSWKIGPDYVPPEETDLPDAWHEAAVDGLAKGESSIQTWWQVLEDPVLNDLIRRAGAGNLTLQESFYRVVEARALRGIATGEKVPSVDAFGSYDRAEFSEAGVAPVPPGTGPVNIWNLGAGFTWELDVWGRVRRSVESATAGVEASVEDYRDVLVGVFAEVALSYVEIRALQDRIDYAHGNIKTQEQTMQLTQDRFAAGLVSLLDVAQSESILAATRSEIPVLETALELAYNRLAVLLGQHAGSLQRELRSVPGRIPRLPDLVAVGLPADLLRQRPDIRAAERELASQTALIGVARGELYPTFGLSGNLQLEALDFSDLGNSSSLTWGLGPFFRWNIFAGGRIRNRIRVEEARTTQALIRYEETVLRAVQEVENSMVAYQNERERLRRLGDSVDATQRSLDLVLTQYKAGLTDFQNVLDTQRSLFDRQDRLAESHGLVVQDLIFLYRAVGGGWDPNSMEPDLALNADAQTAEPSTTQTDREGVQP
ncbi:MAG: efflux transporter outer membrane subunit [Acidobacteria bacterium]|nr:efflux transporter outer membrane subunit [Acidobacteriota bacterium]